MKIEPLHLTPPVDQKVNDPFISRDQGVKPHRLPRWTRQEIITLIEAKRVFESSIGRGKVNGGLVEVEPKWSTISSYCRRHGVEDRGPVQCQKRWSNLVSDFKKIREYERGICGREESFWCLRGDFRRVKGLPGIFDKEVYDILVGGGDGGGFGSVGGFKGESCNGGFGGKVGNGVEGGNDGKGAFGGGNDGLVGENANDSEGRNGGLVVEGGYGCNGGGGGKGGLGCKDGVVRKGGYGNGEFGCEDGNGDFRDEDGLGRGGGGFGCNGGFGGRGGCGGNGGIRGVEGRVNGKGCVLDLDSDGVSMEVEPESVFDSGRRTGGEDGLFSRFEEASMDGGRSEGRGFQGDNKRVVLPSRSVPAPTPISVAFVSGTGNAKEPALDERLGSSQGGKKRKQYTPEEDEEAIQWQQHLIKALERNGNLLSSQLEVQNNRHQLEREQQKDHASNLVAVLSKVADALGKIADKL